MLLITIELYVVYLVMKKTVSCCIYCSNNSKELNDGPNKNYINADRFAQTKFRPRKGIRVF